MRLSDGLIAEFQKRHLEAFGETISAEKAEAELLSLAEIVAITNRPVKKSNEGKRNGRQLTIKNHS